MRIDKYLWCIRVFKTRSLASKACVAGQVKIADEEVKASRTIKVNDVIDVRKLPIWRSYQVVDIPKSRVGAKLVADYSKEVTSADELEKFEMHQLSRKFERERGTGRPTKRERRNIDRFLE